MSNEQRGFTLIEILGSMVIATFMLIGLTTMFNTSLEDVKGQQAALYQAQIVSAATQYIQNPTNFSALSATATTTVPVTISLAQLTSIGPGTNAPYLSPNTAQTNIYQQTPCVLVLKSSFTNKLDAIVVTLGGEAIGDAESPMIGANSGPGGGYISLATPSVAQGATWSLSANALNKFQNAPFGNCLPGATSLSGGHLVSAIFNDGLGTLSNDFLYRDAYGNMTQLNTMNTPILLGSAAIVSEGQTCSTPGLAADLAGNLMRCNVAASTWTAATPWKDPVDTYADLPTNDQPGNVRMVTSLNRAFTYTGTSWLALAVDQNGNMTIPNNLEVQTGQITADAGNISATTGSISAGSNVNAGHDLHVTNEAYVNSTLFALGSVDSPSYTGAITVSPGQACNIPTGEIDPDSGFEIVIFPPGSITRDANGLAMSCYSDNTFRYQNGTYSPTP